MKQTSVEWLYEKLWKEFNFSFSSNILEQAKEIEKKQQDEFAIWFAEWCDNDYFRMGNTNIWSHTTDWEYNLKFTTKELLEIYKKTL